MLKFAKATDTLDFGATLNRVILLSLAKMLKTKYVNFSGKFDRSFFCFFCFFIFLFFYLLFIFIILYFDIIIDYL